jgi:hypothetical protein
MGDVGAVSTSSADAASGAGDAQLSLLKQTMDMAKEQNAVLMSSMLGANAPGVGGSVNAYA